MKMLWLDEDLIELHQLVVYNRTSRTAAAVNRYDERKDKSGRTDTE
jgi:hypothetical protein